MQKGYSSLLSFTVTDINTTVTKLMALGAELDGPIKYEIHGKVITSMSVGIFKIFSGIVIKGFKILYKLLLIRLQQCGV